MPDNSLLDLITGPQAAGARQQIGRQLGLGEAETGTALQALLPALAAGLAANAQKPGGLEALLGALSSGQHDKYLAQPQSLARPETLADGNAILGHLLGSKEMSRSVASAAAKKTGLSDQMLKMALPMIATMVMSQLSQGAKGKAAAGFGADDLMGMIAGVAGGQAQAKQGGGMLGGLMSMFDADKDGSAMDDIFAMVMKSRT